MSKEILRREAARKKERNSRLVKGSIMVLCVAVVPLLIYVASQV